eukprot:4920083-Amphidinium_carterae.1
MKYGEMPCSVSKQFRKCATYSNKLVFVIQLCYLAAEVSGLAEDTIRTCGGSFGRTQQTCKRGVVQIALQFEDT